jgi:hypothetical protein
MNSAKITTHAELARQLKVSRQLVWAAVKRPGAPKPLPDGSLDVEAWREFLAETKLPAKFSEEDRLALGKLKVRKLRAETEREERRNAAEAGETLDKHDVAFALNRAIAQLFDAINQVFLNQMPAQLAGLTELQIAEKVRPSIEQLEARCREELGKLAEEKQ